MPAFSFAFLSLKIERRFWGFLSRASGASHTSNGACFVFRCCVFIAHRATSQQSAARTHGRKNWQLAVAYNGLSALGYGLLFAGCPEHLLFSRRARCRKSNKCHTIRIPVTNNVGKHSVESTFHGRRNSYIFSKKQLTNP